MESWLRFETWAHHTFSNLGVIHLEEKTLLARLRITLLRYTITRSSNFDKFLWLYVRLFRT